MRDTEYEQLARVEDRLWWYVSRRKLVRSLLGSLSLPPQAAALDLGCGTGGTLELLSEFASTVVGLDVSPQAIKWAQQHHPSAEVRLGDANSLAETFEPATFDLVTIFSVLYHKWISSDLHALQQVRRVLKPQGVLVLNEPAFPSLSRGHDRAVMGKRRYTLAGMRELLERAGLEWISGTYFNMTMFLPAWTLARLSGLRTPAESIAASPETSVPPRPINACLGLLMAWERTMIHLLGGLPLGVSLLCAARAKSPA